MKKHVVFVLLALCASLPVLAQPLTVAPGNDGWATGPSGSQIDLSAYPIASVFSSTATVSPAVVTLTGVPLKPGSLGSVDTLLQRFPPPVTFNFIGETKNIQVEIKALRLRGQVTVTDGGISTTYSLTVALSEMHPMNPGPFGPYTGTIAAKLGTPDGGRFDSQFKVVPKLVFNEVGNPANQVVLDCGFVAGCPANVLKAFNVCWVVKGGPGGFNPATKGITPLPAGVAVDGTFDGVNDYTTVGRKQAGFAGLEFHVGFNPVPPFNPCGGSTHEHENYSQNASKHFAQPPTDCKDVVANDPDIGVINGEASGHVQPIDDIEPIDDVEPFPANRLCPKVVTPVQIN